MPVLLVDIRVISPIIVTRPSGFFAEQDRAHMSFRLPHSVNIFPAPHQFMEVLSGKFFGVLSQVDQKLQAFLQERFVGSEVHGYTTGIFVHDLLKPKHKVLRLNIVGMNVGIARFFPVFLEDGKRPEDFLFKFLNASFIHVGLGVVFNNKGYVVTNYHVCKDASRFEINHYKKEYKNIEIFKQNPEKDILILKVKNNSLPPIKTGSSSALKPGQRLYAVGSPEGYENSISEGIVSGVRSDSIGNQLIQMTTPITDGSSGGAVVNSKGELIGMSMSGQHEGNIYFAVPVEDIMMLLETNIAVNNEYDNITEKETLNYLNEGKNANKKQKYEDAIFYFSKYLESNLDDNEAYFYRGYARLKLKEYKLAINDFTKAIGNGTENHETYFYRGNAYYYLREYTNAVKDYSNAIVLAPRLAELYYNRGFANYKAKNFNWAIDDWKKAIELKPEYESELNSKIKSIQDNK